MPATTAIVRLTRKVPKASSSVTGSRCRISCETGVPSTSDFPRSPCSTPPSQSTYCTTIGLFRPSCSRICSLACSEASGPRMTVAGSPGMRFISEKHTTLTIKRIGSVRSRRRIRNATPGNLPPVLLLLFLAHASEPQDAVRVGLEAPDGRLHGEVRGLVVVVEVDIGHVLVQDLHDLAVELLAPDLVAGGARFVEELVHLRVAVARVVEVAVGHREVVDVEIRVDASAPAQEQGLEVPVRGVIEQRPELFLLQLDVDACGLEVILDDLADLLVDRRGICLQGKREPVRLARPFEQRLRLLDAALGVRVALLAVSPGLLAERRVPGLAADVPEHGLDDGLTVNQPVHRLPELLVVERRLRDVEEDPLVAEPGLDGDVVVSALLQLLELDEGDRVYDVELAALQVLVLDVLVFYAPVLYLVDLGQTLPPVIRVLLHGDVVAPDPLDELEGPCADRVLGDAPIVLLYGLRGGHDASAVRQYGEERGERLAQGHPHGHGVDDLDRLDELNLGAPDGVLLLVAVQVVLHGLGVEGGAVLELDALPQMEGVYQV